jgi:hypothetical protein
LRHPPNPRAEDADAAAPDEAAASRLRNRGIGDAFVSKIIAFAGAGAALGFCLWLAPWRSPAASVHDAAPMLVVAGGLFTVAIAVLIRD